MQTTSFIFYKDTAESLTLVGHIQAIERTIQTMHSHMHEELSLEDLAAIAYLSPSRFKHVFRHLIGIPPGEFLSALRLQAARRLLLTTPLSVTDICFEVGYNSMGSFTSRFTQMVGLPPRLLRQRARAFEPPAQKPARSPVASSDGAMKRTVLGQISGPETFQGTIYIGLFAGPIPQGRPVRCTKINSPGWYLLHNVPDGTYHLRAAAFPAASNLQASLLPGENLLLGNNANPVIVRQGRISGDTNLVLHAPRLTDPPLVMGLPLL